MPLIEGRGLFQKGDPEREVGFPIPLASSSFPYYKIMTVVLRSSPERDLMDLVIHLYFSRQHHFVHMPFKCNIT